MRYSTASKHDAGLLKSFIHGSIASENFLCAMKKQMPPTNRYYSLLQVLLFLENQLLFRDRSLEALPRRRTERETPPRAWGRGRPPRRAWLSQGNTPTGVGKSATLGNVADTRRKHPHGRGEEGFASATGVATPETPPRAWGRGIDSASNYPRVRNTPTGVGKRPCANGNPRVCRKHPHGRGEETSGTCRCCTIMETPPRAWGRAANAVRIDPASGNTPTGVGKRAHSNFKQFEYYSIFFSFVKEPGSVCADFSIISCSPDMDVKSFVGMPFA